MTKRLLKHAGKKFPNEYKQDVTDILRNVLSNRPEKRAKREMYSRQELHYKSKDKGNGELRV